MQQAAITHRSALPFRYAIDDHTVRIRLKAACSDLTGCTLLYGDKFNWGSRRKIHMRVIASDGQHDYWQADVAPEDLRLCYAFYLESGNEGLWYTEMGFSAVHSEEAHPLHYFEFPFLHAKERIVPPAWACEAVIYQVFPDRYHNGDPGNDPPNTAAWHSEPTHRNTFGGDLQGIIDKLDHIQAVGANVLYLTPIFESPSSHKYDTSNYYRIDPAFGTADTLKALVDRCHSRGIRVVLDAVFNHSGNGFAPFVEAKEKGAASPYYGWFHFIDPQSEVGNPLSYRAFGFEPNMPKLNTGHPMAANYLIEAALYWTKEAGIDGWRLDVANEVDHEFWRAFRRRLKAVRPDIWMIGEVWHDALPWLGGDQFDSVMNYPLRTLALDFFVNRQIDKSSFTKALIRLLMQYPDPINANLFNMLGSHDTARLITECNGCKDVLKRLLVFQYTFPGVPSIYYGDEIGMAGGGDPECRRTMVWDMDVWDADILQHVQKLAAIRKHEKALHNAVIRFVETQSEDLLFYIRHMDDTAVLVVMNLSDSITVEEFSLSRSGMTFAPGTYQDWLTGRGVSAEHCLIKLCLPPGESVVVPMRSE
ncbi:glycoside hydrolase family 13 protein [Paenibacillus sp. SI8]|uniref:glycoside hydrolase family 13 protein n=1 Tax=unclassified Paenibacillus TaxID=185978 RepID=UPI0034658356